MRLADFFQCGFGSPAPEESPPVTRAGAAAASSRPRNCRRRCSRRIGAGNNGFTPWRPSLAAISENASVAARDGKVTLTPVGSGNPKVVVHRRVLPRSQPDDHRCIDVPTVVPAFSPTAYLF